MPWILGTALIHSLVVTEKRGMFKAWTILLAVGTFSLSLLGTFLVRSGVITSVHSFASDPTRGIFILVLLLIVIGSALVLFSIRAPKLASNAKFELLSKETGLLANNVILVVMTLAVLLGTLFPLITDALAIGKISVGPPYFNMVMVPLAVVLAAVMGVGLLLRWKSDKQQRLIKLLWLPLALSIVAAIVLPLIFAPEYTGHTFMGLLISVWIISTAILWIVKQKRSLFAISGASWGALFGHIGLAVAFIGVTLVSMYNMEKDVSLAPGKSYVLSGYEFRFQGVTNVQGPNYVAHEGLIEVYRDNQKITELKAQKRTYRVQTMPMTEAGIDAGFFRDLFVALGEPLDKKGTWSLRVQYKPFLRWIWLGAILMALGAIMATLDKRYRRLNNKKGVS
jgi:cytochrome c-type biogenesis protein CcmF